LNVSDCDDASARAGAGTTATIPVRVIDVVPETALSTGGYRELLVKINTHQYNDTTGV